MHYYDPAEKPRKKINNRQPYGAPAERAYTPTPDYSAIAIDDKKSAGSSIKSFIFAVFAMIILILIFVVFRNAPSAYANGGTEFTSGDGSMLYDDRGDDTETTTSADPDGETATAGNVTESPKASKFKVSVIEDLVYRNGLDDFYKGIYDGIYKAVANRESYTYTSTDPDGKDIKYLIEKFDSKHIAINEIYLMVLCDHPEIFWADNGFSYNYTEKKITLAFQYKYEKSFCDKKLKELNSAMDQAISKQQFTDDYSKVLWAYEWIADHAYYDHEMLKEEKKNKDMNRYKRSPCGIVLEGASVCEGYAEAFKMFMDKLGVACCCVDGDAGGAHEWNIVKVNGECYQIDPTWGDSEPTPGSSDFTPYPNYAYFCLTDTVMGIDHKIDNPQFYPKCNSDKANYFVHNDMYLTSADIDKMAAIVEKAIKENKSTAQIRFDSKATYNEAYKYVKNGELKKRISANYSTYSYNDDMFVVTIIF